MTVARATVGGDLAIHDLTPKAIERLSRKLAQPNPKYVRAVRMGRWPGAEPETIESAILMPDGALHIPRGAIAVAKEYLAKDGFTIQVTEDRRTLGTPLLACLFPMWPMRLGGLGLRNYQSEALWLFKRHLQGLVVLPCGCGKTRLGVAAIGHIEKTALVLVHTDDLADQWIETIHTLLGFRAGRIGSGVCEADADVVVAIDDSLGPFLDRAPPAWKERFGLVVVDECHHTPSKTFRMILNQLPARWRLGLTATPTREDGLERLMDWGFGTRLVERTTAEMIAKGFLMAAEVEWLKTDFRFAFDGTADDPKRVSATEEALSTDLARNATIALRAAREAQAGESVLVLVGRRTHAKELAGLIAHHGAEAVALTSATGKTKRKSAIAALKDGRLPVLVATSLADEGLDVQRLSRLILAHPQKARGATVQRLGRLLRQWPGKKPRLIDVLDSEVPMFARRAEARRRVYRDAGLVTI